MSSVGKAALATVFCAACYPQAGSFPRYDAGPGSEDLTTRFERPDLDKGFFDLSWEPGPCGDQPEPNCYTASFEAPLPLQIDANPDPMERDQGLARTAEGHVRLADAKTSGSYRLLVPGCRDPGGDFFDTEWFRVHWKAQAPPATSLRVSAQSGNWMLIDDPEWQGAPRTIEALDSPLDLQATLQPNRHPGEYIVANDAMLRVEVQLQSQVRGLSPVLRSIQVAYKCPWPGD